MPEDITALIQSGRITFNLFDEHRSSVYLDGKFVGWLSYYPGQRSKYVFDVREYDPFEGGDREDVLRQWWERR